MGSRKRIQYGDRRDDGAVRIARFEECIPILRALAGNEVRSVFDVGKCSVKVENDSHDFPSPSE